MPTLNVSCLDITLQTARDTSAAEVNRVLREERGYTYGVQLANSPARSGGLLAMHASFRTEVAAAAIAEASRILDEVQLARLPLQGTPSGPDYRLHWIDRSGPGVARLWPLPWPGRHDRAGWVSILASWLLMLLLAALVAAAAFAPQLAEKGVEIEPFKTAITVGFDRSWPFVAWAVLLLVLGGVYYKFFCRYLCPLGAAMTLGGTLRLLDWLPRRAECGQPCQTCRHRCSYDAIEKSGAIRYDRCFQCLDCVGIYHDAQRCAPLILHRKKATPPSV